MPNPVDPPLRETLGSLAEGFFDLDTWINSQGKYKPLLPQADMPWRAPGHKFTPLDLGIIPFFEGLPLEASGEDDLLNRWATVSADPLRYCPLENATGWRANRGLANPPQFGIARGANVLITDLSFAKTSFETPGDSQVFPIQPPAVYLR